MVKDADTLQGIANALIHVRNITRIAKSFRRSDDINHDITSVHDGNYKLNTDKHNFYSITPYPSVLDF